MQPQRTEHSRAAVLRRELPGLRENVPLALWCAYRVGGPAEFLYEAATTGQLRHAVAIGRDVGVPVTVLGLGTNVLIADSGLPGLVVLARNEECELLDGVISCGAGAVLAHVVADTAHRGLAGLEFAGNIPGSIGGAVVGNAGAYGRAVGDVLVSVDAIVGLEFLTLPPRELRLGYRTSVFKVRGEPSVAGDLADSIVLTARFALSPGSRSRLQAEISRDARLRQSKHPMDCPSCGSYFKNPSPEQPAGRYIEAAGLKGFALGRARVSERHANFLVALPGAHAADILALAAEVRRRVYEHAGVELVEEVVHLGF